MPTITISSVDELRRILQLAWETKVVPATRLGDAQGNMPNALGRILDRLIANRLISITRLSAWEKKWRPTRPV